MVLFSTHAVLSCIDREQVKSLLMAQEKVSENSVTFNSFVDSSNPFENILLTSFRLFDHGSLFEGSFEGLSNASDASAFLRQHIHLICQLCLSCLQLIVFLFDVYGVLERMIGSTTDEMTGGTLLRDLIYSEVLNIIPAMARHFSPEAVFACISQRHPSTYPLVTEVLDHLTRDYSLPASAELVTLVQSFKQASDANSYRILVPVLSGMSSETILQLVPKLIDEFGESEGGLEVLRSAFHRVVEARPPPLSRSTLLMALHRYI